MELPLASLMAACTLLVLAFHGLRKTLPKLHDRLVRPVTILMGGLLGVAGGIPVALALNPFVGLQAGTYYNLMILAMCLGFLGFIVGSLIGLVYGGMVLTSESRIMQSGAVPPATTGSRPASTASAARPDLPAKPRSGEEGDAAPSTFGALLAQAERPQDFKHPGGDG